MRYDRAQALKTFSARLKSMRVRRGLTQSELASLVGVSKNAISDFETGRYFPRFEIIISLASELDCGLNFLMGVLS